VTEQYRVDLTYRLAGLDGASADTHSKTWFFDLAAPGWDELLPRLFYDANAGLSRAEPRDTSWLALDGYEVSPVALETMLAWNGEATAAQAAEHLPWILAASRVTWEYTACYLVDSTGAYDGMTGNDFAELILYRALADGRVSDAQAQEFITKLYPGNATIFANREQRLANLVTVRPVSAFRRTPGTTPYVSGPVTLS
jgi:hypothetical protein